MLFGAHVSIAGGIENAPANAHNSGCEVFQMFSRSPRGGKPTYTEATINGFIANCREYKFKEFYIHSPYYINLASSNNRIRYGSITVLRDELEIGTKIGARYVMAHMGSAKDFPEKTAFKMVSGAIDKILDGYNGTTQFLIEMSAGSGQIIGDTFEDIAYIFKHLKNKNVGICLDTCHAFASGYDLRTSGGVDGTLNQLDKLLGIDKLKLLHFNDSLTELGSRRDRHADIGRGFLGKAAFDAMIHHPVLNKLNAILETPGLKKSETQSIALLKQLRK